MRMRLLPAASVILLLSNQLARAQAPAGVGCVGHPFDLVRDGITNVEAHTRAGQPCQIGFGLRGSNIEALRIVERPAHGILGASEKEENRRYVAYAPQVGFVGRDRFEVSIRFTPPGRVLTFTTRLIVDMNVTP